MCRSSPWQWSDINLGMKTGERAFQIMADGFLLLAAALDSFRGTLLLYLDRDQNLRCVWRAGSDAKGFSSEAAMTRVGLVGAETT
jgi:hypothetical protein